MVMHTDPYDASLGSTLAAIEKTAIRELRAAITGYACDFRTEAHIAALREAKERGALCPVLGAGVSLPYALPAWENLIVQLHNEYMPLKPPDYVRSLLHHFGISFISFTRFIISHSVNPTAFLSTLHDILYKDYDDRKSDRNMEMYAALSTDTKVGPAVESLLTYNVDDLFESSVRRLNPDAQVHSVYTSDLYAEPASGIRVIHPHGFLPHKSDDLSQYTQVVLSEAAYHTHYLHQYHWANMAQLQEFTKKTCLFIGLSFSDPNLRRLLDFSKTFMRRRHSHFVIKRAELDNHYNYFFEKDMKILGLNVLWVRDHSEIADVIEKIVIPV